MVLTALLTEERTFKNAKAENVLNFVRVRLENIARFENLINEYEGLDGKQYIYEYKFEKLSAPKNNRVELKAIYTIQQKGGSRKKNPFGKKPILVWSFIVYQLQNDTVLLRMLYRRNIGFSPLTDLKIIEENFTVEKETKQVAITTGKQKGRYRLTTKDIRERKKLVKKAEQIRKDAPFKTWKEIANELDIPERTLRDWRHNY